MANAGYDNFTNSMYSRGAHVIELAYDDFTGGMNTRGAKGSLGPKEARRIRNLEMISGGGKTLTISKAPSSIVATTNVLSVYRYVNGSTKLLVIHDSGGQVSTYNEAAPAGFSIIGSGSTTVGARFILTPSGTLLWTNGTGNMQAWAGSGSATNAGCQTPAATPVASNSGAGNVNGSGKTRSYYQCVVTFVNSRGVEGPPSAASNEIFPVNNTVDLSYAPASSGDIANISYIRFYIFGGDITDYYYLGQTAPAAYPTATHYSFNVFDSEVSSIILNRGRNAPPAGMDMLVVRQNRAWMGTSGSTRLYFSGYDSYENVATSGELDGYDGGYLTLPGGTDDGLVALASFATLLVIGRRRSVYVLYGNQNQQFSMSKRADIGVVNRDSIAVGPNHVYFAGRDRRIYKLTDGEPVWISQKIQDVLDAISATDWDNLKLAWWKDRLVLTFYFASLPNPSIAYIFYELYECWTEETDIACRDIQRLPHPTENRDELVFVANAGSSIQRAFATTIERSVIYTTGEFRYDKEGMVPSDQTGFDEVILEGEIGAPASPSDKLVITLNYDSSSLAYTISQNTGIIYRARVHRQAIGRWLSANIAGKISSGYLTYLAIQVYFHRGQR